MCYKSKGNAGNRIPLDHLEQIPVPLAIIWRERPELVGQTVTPHTCGAESHGHHAGCICDLIGKPVKIQQIYKSEFAGTPFYALLNSPKYLIESEFSPLTQDIDPRFVYGFILQNSAGEYLSVAFTWKRYPSPIDAQILGYKTVMALKLMDLPNGNPVLVYPARALENGNRKEITGAPISFDQLVLSSGRNII
jgi:hypothetical protein